ncbi:tetratricopeptide repeat protein, partial [Arthrobacter sp. RIT-PI-e]|uniref:tetratricopeptide repeat protein n=1 Tax=Arthrobacter sp. RIT-PI-e TaxID=1681197 RepID=UPI000AC038EB
CRRRSGDVITADFAVTSPRSFAHVLVRGADGRVEHEETGHPVPGEVWRVTGTLPWSPGVVIELQGADGEVLVAWEAKSGDEAEPWTATEPPAPAEIAGNDELFLTGLHLQQYRHPTRSPLSYWNEAIRRDPLDSRVRIALADLSYRSGAYGIALDHLEKARARVPRRNANPHDAEVYYLRGLVEFRLGNPAAAEEAWAKASWDAVQQAAAGLELARLYARSGRTGRALEDLGALDRVAAPDRRRTILRVVLLRSAGRLAESRTALDEALAEDPLSATLRFLSDGTLPSDGRAIKDLGVELAQAGEVDAALEVLERAAGAPPTGAGNAAPLAHYLRAQLLDRAGRGKEAEAARESAGACDQRWAFPAGLDDHDALVSALAARQDDTGAAGLLGMLLYDVGRRTEALALWERAVELGNQDPILHRNAGLASYNVAHDDDAAVRHYEEALRLDPKDSRLLFERDQLAQRLGEPAENRLERFESRLSDVVERDDLVVEYAELLVSAGRAGEALELLEARVFQPWEGGEGRVLGAWDRARDALGLPVQDPPASLGEARTAFVPPVARHGSGETDYFATSLPELLLFSRE